jgi:uncharacterized membrane protein
MLAVLAFAIGFVAGLRSMTPLAVVAWFAHLRWPELRQSHLAFMAAPATAWVFTVLAGAELVADKLPFIPSRLSAGPLVGRIVSGGLCAAVLCLAAGQAPYVGAIAGAIGGVAGAFAGFAGRTRIAPGAGIPPLVAALIEDVVAVAGAIAIAMAI